MAMPKKKQSESHGYDFRDHMKKAAKKAASKLAELRIEAHDNGGHTVHHHMSGGDMMPMYDKPKSHAFGKHEGAKMMKHIKAALGMGAAADVAEPDADDEA